MSPILFNLYLGLVLFSLPDFEGATCSYIGDILFRTGSSRDISRLFGFFDREAQTLGLDMNSSKSEVHALEGARHFSFVSPTGATVSTTDENGAPRDYYRYLEVYFYTEGQLSMVHGSTYPPMFGPWMVLQMKPPIQRASHQKCVLCVVKSVPPRLVVNVRSNIVPNV